MCGELGGEGGALGEELGFEVGFAREEGGAGAVEGLGARVQFVPVGGVDCVAQLGEEGWGEGG